MNWSMPRPVLQLVAALIGVAAVGAFAVGILTADAPARLPGERPAEGYGQAIEAQEAAPLTDERIEGPPPPELTPEEKARLEEERKAREEAARLKAEAEAAAPAPPPPAPRDSIGDLLQRPAPAPAPPPVDEPLF